MLTDLESHALRFSPTIKVDVIADDPDNRLLELAETCRQIILLQAILDFTMTEYKGTRLYHQRSFLNC